MQKYHTFKIIEYDVYHIWCIIELENEWTDQISYIISLKRPSKNKTVLPRPNPFYMLIANGDNDWTEILNNFLSFYW